MEKEILDLLTKSEQFNIKYEIPEQNFLSITNFPRYENVVSDILAFFLNVNEQHGFKDLWLKSLLKCYIRYDKKKAIDLLNIDTQDVIREQSTDARKRIDIYIVTGQNTIIIENKIDATPCNPWKSYFDKAKKYYKNEEKDASDDDIEEKIIPILLTVKDEKEAEIDNFINVTYDELFNEIKENVGYYLIGASEKWSIYMNEFMKNIERINGEYKMNNINSEIQSFLKENKNGLNHLLDILNDDTNAKIDYFKDVYKELMKININKFQMGTYNCYYNKLSGYFSVWINLINGKNIIAIEPYISRPSHIICFEIWNRNNKKYDWSKEKKFLKKDYKKIDDKIDGSWGKVLLLKEISFTSNALNSKEFAKMLYDVAKKLDKLYNK